VGIGFDLALDDSGSERNSAKRITVVDRDAEFFRQQCRKRRKQTPRSSEKDALRRLSPTLAPIVRDGTRHLQSQPGGKRALGILKCHARFLGLIEFTALARECNFRDLGLRRALTEFIGHGLCHGCTRNGDVADEITIAREEQQVA
jgi:hypothetical protein